MKNYAIIGFGGLGKTHFLNLLQIEEERKDIRLSAICNSDIESITKNMKINLGNVSIEHIDFSKYNLYTDYKEMIEKEALDFVFITLPSYLHYEVSLYCLDHGVAVYCEKPMAITLSECEETTEASKKSGKCLMIGQSLRFSAAYRFVKEAVEKGTYGKVVKAEFDRRSPLPRWSFENWMLNEDKSGGCIVDMHVHDVDIMVWLFGAPKKIYSLASHKNAAYESVYSLYEYENHMVSIVADWGLPASYKFNYGLKITFENAYLELKDSELTVYTDEKEEKPVLDTGNSFIMAEREFIACAVDDLPLKTTPLESVYETMKTVFLEKEFIKNNKNKS